MKKLGVLLLTIGTFFICSMATAATTTPLNFGVEYHTMPAEADIQNWQDVAQAMGRAMQQEIAVKVYYHQHEELIQDILLEKTIIAYMKVPTAEKAKLQNENIKLLANAVTHDPLTGKDSVTYDVHVVVDKDSSIQNLADLNNKIIAYYSEQSTSNYVNIKKELDEKHIKVKWYKVNSAEAALDAVLEHRADAVSIWDYPLENHPQKTAFKIIETSGGFKNPGLYVNVKFISPELQEKLVKELANVKGPYYIVGFKK